MNGAADQLEALLNEAGVHIDPNAEYHGSGSMKNPNNDFTDTVDAEFEEMNCCGRDGQSSVVRPVWKSSRPRRCTRVSTSHRICTVRCRRS